MSLTLSVMSHSLLGIIAVASNPFTQILPIEEVSLNTLDTEKHMGLLQGIPHPWQCLWDESTSPTPQHCSERCPPHPHCRAVALPSSTHTPSAAQGLQQGRFMPPVSPHRDCCELMQGGLTYERLLIQNQGWKDPHGLVWQQNPAGVIYYREERVLCAPESGCVCSDALWEGTDLPRRCCFLFSSALAHIPRGSSKKLLKGIVKAGA